MKRPLPTILAFAFAVITTGPGATFEATLELAAVVIRDISVLDSATDAWLPHRCPPSSPRSIQVGKIVDVVVLGGDPLASINQTKNIDAVVYRGEALTRAHLNRLLGSAR